jgi:hypothetical protein
VFASGRKEEDKLVFFCGRGWGRGEDGEGGEVAPEEYFIGVALQPSNKSTVLVAYYSTCIILVPFKYFPFIKNAIIDLSQVSVSRV